MCTHQNLQLIKLNYFFKSTLFISRPSFPDRCTTRASESNRCSCRPLVRRAPSRGRGEPAARSLASASVCTRRRRSFTRCRSRPTPRYSGVTSAPSCSSSRNSASTISSTSTSWTRQVGDNRGLHGPARWVVLPYRSVVSCARLTTWSCHPFPSSAALFSW